MTLETIEGTFTAPKGHYVLVVGRFNNFVVKSLVSGAVDTLVRHGVAESEITIIHAPDALEIPLVTQGIAQQDGLDAIIALSAVIYDGTSYFEYVAGGCTKSLTQVSLQFSIPAASGILAIDFIEQAIERSGTKAGDKGAEAALPTLEIVGLLAQLETK